MNNVMPSMSGIGSSTTLTPLYATEYNFTNETQAMDFLSQMLDDTILQVYGNQYSRYFWYGTSTVVCFATIYNFIWRVNLKLRTKAAAAKRLKPAAPSKFSGKFLATFTTMFRKVSYPQLTPARAAFWLIIPPFGTSILVLAYLAFIMALEFINNDIAGAQYYTALGIRAGWLAVAQVPLLILLAGKNNLIGMATGTSFERLNVLHRWVSRGLLLLATLHFGYQNYGWDQYGIRELEWSTDTCPPTGMGAYALLLWLNLSTLAPFRNLCYEFFVFQHLLTFFGFVIAIMLHLPSTALYTRVYIWIPIGLYLFDRSVRTLRLIWHNSHPGQATLETLEGGVTKILVHYSNSRIKRWTPGAHVLLSIPRYGILQSHPATIASTPASHDGDLMFILKSQKGFTRALLRSGNSSTTSLLSSTREKTAAPLQTHVAFIDGPYGASHADFACFDTVLLLAGSTGVTFTLPILLDVAHRASKQRQKLPVRRVEFVWIIRTAECTSWISKELQAAFAQLQGAGIEIRVRVFVTRPDRFADQSLTVKIRDPSLCQCNPSPEQPCQCSLNGDGQPSFNGNHFPSLLSSQPTNTIADHIGHQGLEWATTESGRPLFPTILSELLAQADGETGIAVCGPLGLSTTVRTTVAGMIGRKVAGGQGIYLHVEGFCW